MNLMSEYEHITIQCEKLMSKSAKLQKCFTIIFCYISKDLDLIIKQTTIHFLTELKVSVMSCSYIIIMTNLNKYTFY